MNSFPMSSTTGWVLSALLTGIPTLPALSAEKTATGFLTAQPGRLYRFPRDHASHPGFKTEWWYYTGHLKATTGEQFGFQLTFFRSSLRPPVPATVSKPKSRWMVKDLYFAHFALSDHAKKTFHFDERMSRGALGEAGASTTRYKVWVRSWQAEALGPDTGAVHRLAAESAGFGIDLQARPRKPPVIHGLDGISRKGVATSQASHYISLSRMRVSGTLRIGSGTKQRKLSVSGSAWMDHEFGSSQLGKDQVGWDWFSFQLKNGVELMLYRMRRKDGSVDPFSSGTWVDKDGKASYLPHRAIEVKVLKTWKSKKSGGKYPIRWHVRIPSRRAFFLVDPIFRDQELSTRKSTKVTYWEGAVRVSGEVENKPIKGMGYVEMTGYARAFRKKI